MKNFNFSFSVYQNKFRSLPGFIAFPLILFIILLVPVLFCLILVGGLSFIALSGIIGLFFPKKTPIEEIEDAQVIEFSEVKKTN